MFMLSSMNVGILPDTLEVFKMRTFVIGGSVFPFLTIIMHIWMAKYSKYFKHAIASLIAYWTVVTILGPSTSLIMILVLPIMFVVMIGMIVTFAVTYRTGRLKEVRSGLILIAMAFMTFSQLSKVSLMAIGLAFIADFSTVIGTFLIVLAVANPWKEKSVKEETPPVQEVYA
jgi:peptidoglycan/LPS O-acetylase OafA/YrhL